MSVIEDELVLTAMQDFGQALFHAGDVPADDVSVKHRAYALARACRESLNATWEVIQLSDFPEDAPLVK